MSKRLTDINICLHGRGKVALIMKAAFRPIAARDPAQAPQAQVFALLGSSANACQSPRHTGRAVR